MKLRNIVKILSIGITTLLLTGCGSSSSSSEGSSSITPPTNPTTPTNPIVDLTYKITELPLKGIDNPTLLVNSTYTVSAGKQTYAKFIMKEDGNVLLGTSIYNQVSSPSMALYDSSHTLLSEGRFINMYLSKGEYIVYLNNDGYKSHRYFTLYSKHIDVNYLPLPINTTRSYEAKYSTMWVLKLNSAKVLSMMASTSHLLSLYDENGNVIAPESSTPISESLNAGTYVIYVYSGGRRNSFELETTLE